jgi:hypothetical protein
VQKENTAEDDKKKSKRPDLKAISKVSEDSTSLWLFLEFYPFVLLLIELLFMNNSSQVQFHLS